MTENGGVVDEKVEGWNLRCDFARTFFYGAVVGQVYVNAGGAASGCADLGDGLVCHGLVQVGDEDSGAFGGEALRCGSPDA